MINRTLVYCLLALAVGIDTGTGRAQTTDATPAPKVHDRWPSFSPDGNTVAFERSVGKTMDIYVVAVSDGTAHRVTTSAPGALSMAPAWLPDGRLLYTTTSPSADYPDGWLHVVSINGQNDRTIQRAGARERSVSPDGRYVLFVTQKWEVAIQDLSTGNQRILTHPEHDTWDTEAAWSPDGRTVAFGCNFVPTAKIGRSDICLINADGSGRKVIIERTDASEWITWSPDGSHLAFQADQDDYSAGQIVVADVATGETREISRSSGFPLNETPSWSRDGTWIAFQVRTDEGYRIALVHPDGTGYRRLT